MTIDWKFIIQSTADRTYFSTWHYWHGNDNLEQTMGPQDTRALIHYNCVGNTIEEIRRCYDCIVNTNGILFTDKISLYWIWDQVYPGVPSLALFPRPLDGGVSNTKENGALQQARIACRGWRNPFTRSGITYKGWCKGFLNTPLTKVKISYISMNVWIMLKTLDRFQPSTTIYGME